MFPKKILLGVQFFSEVHNIRETLRHFARQKMPPWDPLGKMETQLILEEKQTERTPLTSAQIPKIVGK